MGAWQLESCLVICSIGFFCSTATTARNALLRERLRIVLCTVHCPHSSSHRVRLFFVCPAFRLRTVFGPTISDRTDQVPPQPPAFRFVGHRWRYASAPVTKYGHHKGRALQPKCWNLTIQGGEGLRGSKVSLSLLFVNTGAPAWIRLARAGQSRHAKVFNKKAKDDWFHVHSRSHEMSNLERLYSSLLPP